MSFVWTDDAIAELRRCVAAGWSASRTADHIGEHFDGFPSRNAIIGKALRLKLQWKNAPGERRAVQKRKPLPRQPRQPVVKLAPAGPVEPLRAIPPAPNSRPVDLMGLTNSTCRWPITDEPPHMFCGALEADMANGVPYCPMHSAAAVGRAYTRQERFEFRRRNG